MRSTGAVPNGGRKRAHSRRATPVSAAPPETAVPEAARELAGFAPIKIDPIDARKWLVHPFLWLQPELTPAAPSASGLWIERRHKIPIPGFARVAVSAILRPKPAEAPAGLRPPEVPRNYPESELAPLGWDPRALAGSKKDPQ